MIRRLKYNEIDFVKYAQCLENSEQRKYSATKDFLDTASTIPWEILVYKDYEAVMPVPFVRKYGLKIVHNPKLCQQLGVFSHKDNVDLNEAFLEFLKRNYMIRAYPFNDINQLRTKLRIKKNFLLYPDSYEKVYNRYSPKRKRKLRLDESVLKDSEIKIISYDQAKIFIEANTLGLSKDSDLPDFMRIFESFHRSGYLKFTAFYYQHRIINVIATYRDGNMVALLGNFNDKDYVKLSGASVLIDHVIKENIETHIFDFEGGELPNIEEFFRGFRPELKPYGIIENSKKNLFKKLGCLILGGKSFL
ncbi:MULTISPECIES: GNAT family N-acetyltransferase [unclassified Chryseobacterium]|uniref:GNAT family N-acetyltransferase n=1 Tax=unclassified Chryseobacterium TaxID=2593645 RepID=UPI0011582BFC|nr:MULTISPECIES: GNAT family N-acetyltransferase [unclassified Chryseobacterium]MBO9691500.1 hypothetical protein [Chryseobacterium sp.]GEJ43785.1 hypothetical protein CRS_03930 [Chryseobacterium sp. ON_d1]